MIGYLVGRVVHEEPTGGLLLDVQGVGYELLCPVGTRARAQAQNDRVAVHVHTTLRQDALELFGFANAEDRAAFRQLIQVPNVGPRLAVSILSVLPSDELARVLDTEDKARLAKVPGIGKKTAERLVLELRGKLATSQTKVAPSASGPQGGSGDLTQRLVAALTGLGYKPTEAERAAKSLVPKAETQDLSSLLREALKYLTP